MGDWNARVGSNDGNDQWKDVTGQHGLGKTNEAGLDILSFCAMNNLALMNTFFKKKDIYKQMWQHPGTKAWHCIDFIVMRQHQHKKCLDVKVMRGAECWTDHQMVRATVNVDMGHTKKTRKREDRSRPHVKLLHSDKTIQTAFNKKLGSLLDSEWPLCTSAEEKWEKLVS